MERKASREVGSEAVGVAQGVEAATMGIGGVVVEGVDLAKDGLPGAAPKAAISSGPDGTVPRRSRAVGESEWKRPGPVMQLVRLQEAHWQDG